MRTLNTIFFALAFAGSAACGKDHQEAPPSASTVPSASAVAAPAPCVSAEPPKPVEKVELEIESVANTMTFDKVALTVHTGAEVHLTFKSHATMATLPHNWVLVRPGTEASVAAAGLKYGEKAGYIDVNDHDMLAHTTLAKPGETSEATFTAPEPGQYPYICSVPGHYMLMKGVLTVTP